MFVRENPDKKKNLLRFAYEVLSYMILRSERSHKKQKDNLEGSLSQVLFTSELEFSKILVPRLRQKTSNVNVECAGKSN